MATATFLGAIDTNWGTTTAGQWSGGTGTNGSPGAGDDVVISPTAPSIASGHNAWAAVSVVSFTAKYWNGNVGTADSLDMLVTSGAAELAELTLSGSSFRITGTYQTPVQIHACTIVYITGSAILTGRSLKGATYSVIGGTSGICNIGSGVTVTGLLNTAGMSFYNAAALAASGTHEIKGGSHYSSGAQTNGTIRLSNGATWRQSGTAAFATVIVERGCTLIMDSTGGGTTVTVESGGTLIPGTVSSTLSQLYRAPGANIIQSNAGATLTITTNTPINQA